MDRWIVVAAAYPSNVPRHTTAIQRLLGGRKSALGTQRPRVCLWLSFAHWSHILLVYHIPSWKLQTQKPPLKLGWARLPLTRDRVLGCTVTEQLRMPVVGMGTM